jgi:uncharacterized membrane protein
MDGAPLPPWTHVRLQGLATADELRQEVLRRIVELADAGVA